MSRRLCLLLLAAFGASTQAWVITSRNSKATTVLDSASSTLLTASSKSGGEDEESRRSFLATLTCFGSILVAAATVTPTSAFAAEVGDDPFAQLDSIAAKIQESSNYPNSISPLPTFKQTEQELTALEESEKVAAASSSDMNEALKEARKRKQIGPTTHG